MTDDSSTGGNESYPRRPQRYPHPRNCYRTAWGTWFVQFQAAGEKVYSGTHATMDEAVAWRDWALEEIRKSRQRAASTDASTAAH